MVPQRGRIVYRNFLFNKILTFFIVNLIFKQEAQMAAGVVRAAVQGAVAVQDQNGHVDPEDNDAMLQAMNRFQGIFDVAFLCLTKRQIMEIEQWTRPILAVSLVAGAVLGFVGANYPVGASCSAGLLLYLPSLFLMRQNYDLLRTIDEVQSLRQGNVELRASINQANEAAREASSAAQQIAAENTRLRENNTALREQIDRLTTLKTELEATVLNTQEALNHARTLVTEIQAENTRLRTEIDRLEATATDMHGAADRIGERAIAIQVLGDTLATAQATLREREAYIARLEEETRPMELLLAQIDELQRTIRGLETRVAEAERVSIV